MPDYSRRPGAAPESPRAALGGVRREVEAARRDRLKAVPKLPLVKLDPEESTSWPPGTAWLDMSVVLEEGDL